METLVFPAVEFVDGSLTRYELPPEGISKLGYQIRRMHKTSLLLPVSGFLAAAQLPQALIQIAIYATSAAVSFGKMFYEPTKDPVGTSLSETDPKTKVKVTGTLQSTSPSERSTFTLETPDGARYSGVEEMEESKFGIHGWVMPSRHSFQYVTSDEAYSANFVGTIVREITPTIVGPWRSRAHGQLELTDNYQNTGQIQLQRNAKAIVTVSSADSRTVIHQGFTIC